MPKLSELTDAYTPQETIDSLPVESPFVSVPVDADGVRRVRIDTAAPQPYDNLDAAIGPSFGEGVTEHPLVKQLFGLGGETRYQLWPERMVREGLTAAGDVMSGKVPQWAIDPETGDVHTSPNMIEKAQEISALAGTGGLAGITTDATLGATPFLRPALKYKDKLYKGKDGQQHLDVIPESIYPEFQKKAMSGEDINDFKFGFVNDKGHFLDRETALKYGIDTGLVDPAAGKFGALTSTLMADSSKPGIAIEAMKTAQPFFSAVEHNVNAIPQAKMTGDQWQGTLSNKPGVKPEEMQWTGLQDFLMENKGKPVTKEQIVEHLNNNKVELKEVGKGEAFNDARKAEAKSLLNTVNELEAAGKKETPEYKQAFDKLQEVRNQSQAVATKYHGYQLPGGENYREMLLTLPDKRSARKVELEKKAGEQRLTGDELKEFQSYDKDVGQYKSSHWDEPNILAHVRMNDRTIDGKKSLHLEEIQSDSHQAGREHGYKGDSAKVANAYRKATAYANSLDKNHPDYGKAWEKATNLGNELSTIKDSSNSVPDFPFKKTWHELALKRMLREAAERGMDRLSWTPGEAQAARYDLSKQIGGLKATPIMDQHGLKYEIRATNKAGTSEVVNQVATAEELPNIVGKEMAKKIVEESEGKKPVHYKGLDLKVGGEGMKGFYDKMIPQALEKLGKEHGVKVKRGEVETHKGYPENISVYDKDVNHVKDFKTIDEARAYLNNPANGLKGGSIKGNKAVPPKTEPVHYIDIPQSLKDAALNKGFPLFSSGGFMLMPVSHDPFADKK